MAAATSKPLNLTADIQQAILLLEQLSEQRNGYSGYVLLL